MPESEKEHPDEQVIVGWNWNSCGHQNSASQPALDGRLHRDDDAVVKVSRMTPVLDVYTVSALMLVPESAANNVDDVQSLSEHEKRLTTWEYEE